jgi:hypothetical protein
VIARTQGKQTPWESSSVVGNFIFKVAPATQVASLAAPAAAPRDSAAEIAFWNSVKDSQDPRDFQAYLDSYPNGVFDKLARVRLAALGDMEKTRSAPVSSTQASGGKAKAAGPDAKQTAPAVASLTPVPPAAQPGAAFVDTGNFEGTLRQNWPAVEAVLKEHVKKEYNSYRNMIPTYSGGLDVRLNKAALLEAIDAEKGRVKVYLEGMIQQSTWSGGNMLNWRPFRSHFAYTISFVDSKPVIGDYQYLSQAPPPAE